MDYPRSSTIFARSARTIAGGVVSLNRLVEPHIAFARGAGAHIWDADGHEYVDYHGAFGPHILGHNHPAVNAAVQQVLTSGASLFGSGTTETEAEVAELLVAAVPGIELVQLTNTGSEATYHALRLARAYTGREHIVVMQGGYNGWHNDVAVNTMTPLAAIGPRVSPGEYPLVPLSAGIPAGVRDRVHVINYNDLDSAAYVFRRYDVAALILEPVLQNVGVVPPRPGYLQGLRRLCTEYGVVLVFDEVKTGFRAALGGYQSVCGVQPDLTVLGKAVANGFPLGVIGGRRDIMTMFADADPARHVMIAGTYNAHPVALAAASATLRILMKDGGAIYDALEKTTGQLAGGILKIMHEAGIAAVASRVGSAFCLYFMDHVPADWHDLAANHDFDFDLAYRLLLIAEGVYHFPLAAKQGSISAAHTQDDIELTLAATRRAVAQAKAQHQTA